MFLLIKDKRKVLYILELRSNLIGYSRCLANNKIRTRILKPYKWGKIKVWERNCYYLSNQLRNDQRIIINYGCEVVQTADISFLLPNHAYDFYLIDLITLISNDITPPWSANDPNLPLENALFTNISQDITRLLTLVTQWRMPWLQS